MVSVSIVNSSADLPSFEDKYKKLVIVANHRRWITEDSAECKMTHVERLDC